MVRVYLQEKGKNKKPKYIEIKWTSALKLYFIGWAIFLGIWVVIMLFFLAMIGISRLG